MTTIVTGTLTACSGGEHLTLPLTVDGVDRTLTVSRDELLSLAPSGFDEMRTALLMRLRSAVLEATTGNPTALQVRNAVSGKTFEI